MTIRPLITDKALEKVEEHLKDAMEKAALDKRGETGVLSNTDVHYYGPAANAQKTADLLNKLSMETNIVLSCNVISMILSEGSLVAILQQCITHPRGITN